MKHRLRSLKLEELSLVDRPANDGARVLLHKSEAPGWKAFLKRLLKSDTSDPQVAEQLEQELDNLDLTPDQRSSADETSNLEETTDVTLEEMQKALEKALAPVTERLDNLEKGKGYGKDKMSDSDEEDDEDMDKGAGKGHKMKKADEGVDIAKAIEAATAPLQKQLEEMQKAAERIDLRKTADRLHVAAGVGVDELTDTLQKLDATGREALIKALEHSAKLLEASAVFKTFGSAKPANGSAEARLDAMANELRKSDSSLTFEQAYDQALRTAEGKELYKQLSN